MSLDDKVVLTHPTNDDEATRLISDASRALAFGGLGDMVWGHVSVRDPAGRGLWMKAAGWGLEEIVPDLVQLISWDGEVLRGVGPRHIEYVIHSEAYRARGDVGSVVHAHSDTINAWCALDQALLPLTHAGILFNDPELPKFTETANLIRTPELGRRLAACLGDAIGVVIPHHGFVTVGSDVPTSVVRAVLLERSVRTLMLAASAGQPVSRISDQDRADMSWPPSQVNAAWGYLVRRSRLAYAFADRRPPVSM
jgi:ribulose-5-phosphate 4-epimerase/fuculose-1-phosphate aldolase